MRLQKLAILPLAVIFGATSVAAADCATEKADDQATFLDCYTRVFQAAAGDAIAERAPKPADKAAAKKEQKSEQEADLQRSGNSSEQADAAESIKDFLPGLLTGLGFGDLSEADGSQTLKYTFPATGPWVPALKAVRRDGEPLEALVKAIPEAIRANRKSSLEEGIGDFDDLTFSFSFGFEGQLGGRYFGRNFATYDDITSALFDQSFDEAAGTGGLSPGRKALVRRENQARAAGELVLTLASGVQQAFAQRPAEATALESLVVTSAEADGEAAISLQRSLAMSGYFDLADLIRNQPQLHGEVFARARDGAVGPDEWGVTVTWEHGFGTFNRALAHCRTADLAGAAKLTDAQERQLGEALGNRGVEAKSCLARFVEENRNQIGNGSRLTFKAGYTKTDAFRFELPDDGFTFTLDDVEKLEASLTIGRSLQIDNNGVDLSRFDLEAKYEDVTGDPMRHSRFNATATLSQRLSDTLSASMSAVYANRPEYRGAVDEELSARAGLKWKLSKKDQKVE